MAVDWLAIRNDYINGGGSYRSIAKKYGVTFSVLKDKAVKGKWAEAKREHENKIRTEAERKTQEKISDALSDEAAKKVRLRTGLLDMAINWLEANKEGVFDTGDFRRMVQSCIDLGVMDTQGGDEVEDDGLLNALDKIACNLFDDGDDSGMLPKEKD